jgi:hypothetical protein
MKIDNRRRSYRTAQLACRQRDDLSCIPKYYRDLLDRTGGRRGAGPKLGLVN